MEQVAELGDIDALALVTAQLETTADQLVIQPSEAETARKIFQRYCRWAGF